MADAIQLSIGAVVGGDFRILEPLRAGGMGAVYVAEQLSTGKRRALKVMHAGLIQDPRLRERFEREARVGALVASDHVVDVLGAGIDAGGTPWIAMELLDGDDLAEYVRHKGRLPRAEVREIVRQLGHALTAAHKAGVVHRDLKPENVFLAKSRTLEAEGRRTVKVLDFGIAKLVASARTTATVPMGTPAWMSPEQTDPRAAITPASDVWALGLIAFWLLSGRPYWNCALDPSASIHAILREILFEELEPASGRARGKGASGSLPPGFDAWFSRSLARDPAARFPDAGAQLAALEAVLDAAGTEGDAVDVGSGVSVEQAGAMSTRSFVEAAGLARSGDLGALTEPRGAIEMSETQPSVDAENAAKPGAASEVVSPKSIDAASTEPIEAAPKATAIPAHPPAAKPRAAWLVGAAIAAGALFVAGRFTGVGAPPAPAPSAIAVATAASATPSGSVATATPTAAPTVESSAEPVASSQADHGAHTGAGPHHASSATPSAPPFNMSEAQRAVQLVSSNAHFICKDRDGPRALSATVVFSPNGGVERVEMDPMTRNEGTGFCWSGILLGTRIQPFRGPPQGVPAAIAF